MKPPGAGRHRSQQTRHRPAGAARSCATACGGRVVLLVATVLGAVVVGAGLAVHARGSGVRSCYWRSLVILNCSYWYLWALFTPAIVWLSQHFRFEWRGLWRAVLVHVPAVVVFSVGHIAAMSGVQLWLATPGRQAVRVVGGRPALGTPELRLGDDHLLGDRRPEPRGPVLPRVARPRAAHVPARDAAWSKRSWPRCSSSCTRTSSSTRCTPSRR